MSDERVAPRDRVRTPASTVLWILAYCALVGVTLDNTHPYQGDETYYVKSAVGMMKAGNLLVPQYDGVIRLQKPVVAYWMTVAGYKLLGISLWAGRAPFLLTAAALLFLVYRFALLIHRDHDFGFLAVVLLSSSTLFLLFSRVSMTDLPLALFSTLALYCFCRSSLTPAPQSRDVWLAWFSTAAGFLTKGVPALLPVAAMAAFVVFTRRTEAVGWLRTTVAPRYLCGFVLVVAPWYLYLWLAFPDQLRSQVTEEAAANLGPSVAAILAHVPLYLGSIVAYQLPGVILAAWAWSRRDRLRPWPAQAGSPLQPLAWFVMVSLAVFVILFARHRDRYLLLVVPALALIMAHIVYRCGAARPARRLAGLAAFVQIAALWTHSYVVGRPLHDLVRYWEHHLQGDLAVCGLADRETTWTLVVAGGRVVPCGDESPFVIAPAEHRNRFPGHDILRTAARASTLERTDGRVAVLTREFVLLGLRGPHRHGVT